MKIKIIDYGYEQLPFRAHGNDAGADVRAITNTVIRPHEVRKIGLGFGVCIPDGYAAFIYPRSGWAAKGVTCELPPIDSGYRGEIHAIMNNHSSEFINIQKGDRIGQLIIMPIIIADFVKDIGEERGTGSFGSTGLQ